MNLVEELGRIVGLSHVLSGVDAAPYGVDWTKKYVSNPLAVVRPGSTQDVSKIMALAHAHQIPVVPCSGRTGLTGATEAEGALMLSVERMNAVREIRPNARIAVVEAGVVLSNLHDAVAAHDLVFPLTLGAKGTAMIGGLLSTNAGGSNVVRFGSTRGLVLGIEVVLADGRVMDLMSELHKDNSGYDLKDLFIGGEGTLGIITSAVVKLFPKPGAYATAMVAAKDLRAALKLLNTLQIQTDGAVEAFEYMPRSYVKMHLEQMPGAREPFDQPYACNIMVEVAATAPRDYTPNDDGSIPIVEHLEDVLANMMEADLVLDAVVAKSDAQRTEMWERREAAGQMTVSEPHHVNNDICVPTDKVPDFFERMDAELATIDPGAWGSCVTHLGDGNIHYVVYPKSQDPDVHEAIMEKVEDVTLELGGAFSAEHGIGLSKLGSMSRRKDPLAIEIMRSIKTVLDPKGIMNPGKVLPAP